MVLGKAEISHRTRAFLCILRLEGAGRPGGAGVVDRRAERLARALQQSRHEVEEHRGLASLWPTEAAAVGAPGGARGTQAAAAGVKRGVVEAVATAAGAVAGVVVVHAARAVHAQAHVLGCGGYLII
jgi:hypothetical protein